MLELGFKQIVIAAGFIIILVAIPISFILFKNNQILNSKAYEQQTARHPVTQPATSSAKPKEVPATSPLDDLKRMLKDATNSSSTTSLTPTPLPNLAFGPTLTVKINIEGRTSGHQAAKVFIGIANGATQTRPTYVLSFTVDFPGNGIFNGLSLAGLNPGTTYTAYVKGPGQIDTASTFVMSPTESNLNNNQALTLISGDLNEDNTINSADYTIAKNLYGLTSKYSNWNERADINRDSVINNLDLAYVTKNMGKTGSSGIWYSSVATSSATPTATSSGSPRFAGEAGSPLDIDLTSQISTRSGGYWLWVP